MTDNDKFAINEASYDRIVRSFEIVRKRLGLNIKAHHNDGLMERGQIFLFNHFARFETVIPPFLIHRHTGAYCRTIADASLFETSDGFDKFLRSVGAMSNQQPGLLAFLAAEILRGRKVIIFPEGGMVKDRKVINETGGFSIFSRTARERRKHHLGGAVLALTLDIFKRRVRDLFARGDRERIERWVTSLGLDNSETLRKKANEPTFIVPANITFYPLRIEENILSRGVELLARGLPDQFMEELVIEGNLLLRDTDMDIRFNDPVVSQKKWNWWELKLLDTYFETVTSLDDLFGLREDNVIGWSEKILARCILKETYRIRDTAMASMYGAVTVNLSHLASYMVTRLVAGGHMEIAKQRFHRALYIALKKLQENPNIHLHRSLFWPDRYQGLLDGGTQDLKRFFGICKNAGLIGLTPKHYRFTTKLSDVNEIDDVRLENPVLVYANEVTPIDGVRQAVDDALEASNRVSDMEIAVNLFDDELRAHTWNRNHFTKPRYQEINDQETATESGAPFLLIPKKNPIGKGVLLVHGFLASPAELADYGKSLSDQGYAVLGVRLAGHGTSPWDLKDRTWQDWLISVEKGYRIISAFAEKIIVVGFSAGGILSLMLAAQRPEKLIAVAAICAPQDYRNRNLVFVPLVHGLNKLSEWLPAYDGIIPFRENESEHPDINYRHMPFHGLYQLRALSSELPACLGKINLPTLIIQADNDPVVDPNSARQIFSKLTVQDKSLHWIAADRHGILNENIGETCKLLTDFIARSDIPTTPFTRHHPPPAATSRSVHLVFEDAVARWPERPCVDFMGQSNSYEEIGKKINQAARGFQNLGINKGDRIGLCLPNCPYYVISYYAAVKIGATVVNFNPLYTEEEIRTQIVDSGTQVMVTIGLKTIYPKIEAALHHSPLRSIVVCSLSDALPAIKELLFNVLKRSQISETSHDIRVITFDKLIAQDGKPDPVAIDPATDIALLQYTGGTTGSPKGAMLTHANITANIQQVQIWMGDVNPEGERFLCVIPFFHVFAMTAAMNLGIATGSELILLPRFDLVTVLKTIDAKKPTLFPAVPTIFGAINEFEDLARYDLSSIRFCISGGASLPATVKSTFESLTGCVVVEGYGMTEASPVISCNPPDAENKANSIGLPLPWTEVEIRDLDDRKKTVATGERGQLAIRGPQVMAGYWNRPQDTAATLQGGWLLSGDVGYVDPQGYLFLTDRLKDVIFCSGFKVYPRIIEEAFYKHPDVEEVTVIGIADDYRGETPKAFVKRRKGSSVTEQELLTFSAQQLNAIERPTEIEIRAELPKTMIGKLSKKELVSEHQEKQEIKS